MIIFTSIPDTINVINNMFGTHNYYELNLSNIIQRGFSLAPLLVQNIFNDFMTYDEIENFISNEEFDIMYLNSILNDPQKFFCLMNIIMPEYQDDNPCVIIYTSGREYADLTVYNIVRIINNRYGYRPYIINEYSDFEYIKEFANNFSPSGIITMQEDCERAVQMGYFGAIPLREDDIL